MDGTLTPDQEAFNALCDELLCHETKYLEGLKEDAKKARLGLPTGIRMFSVNSKDEASDIELVIPKFAITIVAARTSGGKTTCLTDMTTRLVMRGNNGLYVTLEEGKHAINAYLLSSYSTRRHPNHSMLQVTRDDAMSVIAGTRKLDYLDDFRKNVLHKCRVVDANGTVDGENIEKPSVLYYPQYIANLINYRNSKSASPLDFVMIDFGQLLESYEGYDDPARRIRTVMQALKNLAGTGISVVIGAQMKRECMSEPIWKWEPEQLRDGSDMEQAANLIVAIGKEKNSEDMVLRYLKNRNGPKRVGALFDIDFAHCRIPDQGRFPDAA